MDLDLGTGLSVAAGATCLVIACLIWTVGRGHSPRLVVALVIGGMAAILNTWLGRTLSNIFVWVDNQFGALLAQMLGTAVVGLLVMIPLYIVCRDVYANDVDDRTVNSAFVVPIGATAITGPLGPVLLAAIMAIGAVVTWIPAWAFGQA